MRSFRQFLPVLVLPGIVFLFAFSLALGKWFAEVSPWPLAQPAQALTLSSPCDPTINPIVCENQLPGNPPSQWAIQGAGDPSIQGFATDISVNQGDTVTFKINTTAITYTLTIYRLGYYGGMGARQIATVKPSVPLPQSQPACLTDATTGLIDCGNWAPSASWTVPLTATSGIYFAKLVRPDTEGASHIFFVVRNDAGRSPLLFQTSDTTWQAYNNYGGNSLYEGLPAGRAYKVSYNRPFNDAAVDPNVPTAISWVFNSEYPMVRWLEANGYNVSYFTGVDSERYGSLLKNHKVFLSVGHDEYWSGGQRASMEAARAAGVNLAFFSGDQGVWKTRWEKSIDGSGTPYRTLVCYKETFSLQPLDPLDPPIWTGTWRDPRFSPPADGGRPENALSGSIYTVNGPDFEYLTVPSNFSQLRFWRNTAIARLAANQTYTFPYAILGYEWDEDLDNRFRPAGVVDLSSTTVNVQQRVVDYGATFRSGVATHRLTLYRSSSGALVFNAGTVQWSWGLDANHDNPLGVPTGTDVNLQQATVNLLADMGVQPATLQPGLVPAAPSTDTTPPTSTITSPVNGAIVPNNTVTITGTATDSGGGVVAGVEVSVDGGATWHRARGTTNWSYSWIPSVLGPVTLRSRATDDSGNIETPAAGLTVTVVQRACPCSIWSNAATPAEASRNDPNAIEVGVKFRSDVNGLITGLRFYKGPANTGTHVGHLWTSNGVLLASATFTNETATGWQQVNFAAPVPIIANTTYVASYHTDVGGFAANLDYFTTAGVNWPPLHALQNGVDGPNGVEVYSTVGTFPTQTYQATNYWVDVVFTPDSTGSGTPTATPTATLTSTLTPTATATSTNSPTATPTSTPTPTATSSPTPTATSSSASRGVGHYIQSALSFTANPVSSQTASFGNAVTSGDLIVVAVAPWNSSDIEAVSSVTDSAGNPYSKAVEDPSVPEGAVQPLSIWYAPNVVGGTNFTVTVTLQNPGAVSVAIHEYGGLAASNVVDQVGHANGNGSQATATLSAATSQANDLLFSASTFTDVSVVSATAGSNYTLRQSQPNDLCCDALFTEDQAVNVTGQYTATFSYPQAVNYRVAVVAFRSAGS